MIVLPKNVNDKIIYPSVRAGYVLGSIQKTFADNIKDEELLIIVNDFVFIANDDESSEFVLNEEFDYAMNDLLSWCDSNNVKVSYETS